MTAPEIQWIRDDASLAQQCTGNAGRYHHLLDTEFVLVNLLSAASLVSGRWLTSG